MFATEDDATLPPLDDLISIREAASLIPSRSRGKRTHVATVFRWTDTGCRGVKLKCIYIGSTRYTTRAYLNEFISALNATPSLGGSSRPKPASTPAATVNRAHERAERELEAAGI